MNARADEGFSLLEVVVAGAVLSIAVAGAAAMGAVAVRLTVTARTQTQSLLLAADKLEELRTTGDPAGAEASSLDRDEPGFADFVDGQGHRLTGDGPRPGEAVFVRRWAIHPFAEAPGAASIVQVRVAPVAASRIAADGRVSGEVTLLAVRARRQP